jgi:hypothetical protein
MVKRFCFLCIAVPVMLSTVHSQENITVNPADSVIASQLDLSAVGNLFRQSHTLEGFEKALNDSTQGINNLDLDGDGKVDFIRVVEEVAPGVHLVILQVPIDSIEYQDVATIEIERSTDNRYDMQVHGNDVLYGENYYVAPSQADIDTWPIVTWIYAPAYVPYRSPYYFRFYPSWWHAFHPVAFHAYRHHVRQWRSTFVVVHTPRVRNIHRVSYVPRTATIVERRWTPMRHHGTKVRIHEGRKATKQKAVKRKNARRH